MAKFYSALAGGLLSILALGSLPAAGQTQPTPVRCSTEEVNARIQAELKRTIPGYNSERKATLTPTQSTGRTGAITYTLPIIVHVINNGEAVGVGSNISQAQVQSQIDVLNEDYRNLNADGSLVPTVYQPRRGDMQVQFVNALRDPNGNTLAEPGIDRVNRNTKGFTAPPYATTGYIDATIKTSTSWDPSRYINIWVLNLGGGLLGYAQFPDNNANLGGLNTLGGSAATDGVVILYSAFGSRVKAPAGTYAFPNVYDRGRTLTHELGHWFGFRHIWGDAACGDDYCADTPTQQKENYNCVTFPQVTCSNVTGDMSMNYMDYSNDACMYMFTQAQKDRLQAVMASNTPRRTELVNSNVACPTVVPATAAVSGPGCIGGSAGLTATGPAGATYAWTGPNGFTSTAQNPALTNLTVASAGTYKVTVTLATGTACPGVATATLVVNPTPAAPTITPSTAVTCSGSPVTLTGSGLTVSGTLPSADFNAGAPTGWTIGNTGAAATTWQYTAGTTLTYSGGFRLTNFSLNGSRFAYAISDAGGSGSVTNTTLTSPDFSTVGYSALSVSFQQFLVLDSGTGAVEISTNGGTTWTPVATYSSDVNPAATSTVNLAGYLNQPSVRLRWHYTDAWGYLWAIDNVVVTGTPATYNYAWSLVSGNGLPTTTNTASIAVSPTQNSVYRLTVNYAGATCAASSTVNVNVYPTPVLATSISSVCAGGTAVLSVTNAAALTPTPTYSWTVVSGDGLPAVTNTPTITVMPTQASVYRLTLSFPGSTCTTTSTVSVGFGQPVWTGATGNGNWFDAGNWTGCVPTRTTDATIPAGLTTPYPTIGAGTGEVRSLTQQGTLTMTGGELDLYGDHTGTGTLTLNAGIVATRGTVAQALRGATYQTLLVAGTGTKTIPTSTVNQALTMSGAILNTGTATVTLAPAATITETDATYVLGKVQTTHTVGTSPDTFGGLGLVLTPATAPGATTVLRTTGQVQGITNQSISRYYDISATVSRSLRGITLAQSYFDHELNGLTKDRLVMYKSVDGGATWSSEGATSRNNTANTVTRNAVTDLQGRWTLGGINSVLTPATVQYAITPLPIPFTSDGLSLQVTTPDAGQLSVQLYDILGRVIYNHEVGNLDVGTSTITLPGSGQLKPGKYILLAKKGYLEIRVNVERGE